MSQSTASAARPATTFRGADEAISARAVTTKRMLACGALAGPLFVIVGVIQAVTVPGFNLTHNALSALTLGNLGWIQSANFIFGGALSVIGAIGLHRALRGGPASKWAPRLLTVFGVGLVGGGLFHPDPSLGFPPGTPADASAVSTLQGAMHLASGSTAFVALIVTCLVLAVRFSARGDRRSAICSRIVGIVFLAGVMAGGVPGGTLALFVGVSLGWIWVSLTEARVIAEIAA